MFLNCAEVVALSVIDKAFRWRYPNVKNRTD